ncbi:choice-of-anchor Q domain-containing protein [Roseiflexus castenholzii]|uniref:choice-of-anchor Q domain-containing protein n=1 Tax=Roseiflexus castenholzii TaxID=120962 RepID=UPI003C7975DD
MNTPRPPSRWRRLLAHICLTIACVSATVPPLPGMASAPAGAPGAPPAACTPPIAPVTLVNPTVITSCTQANLQAALATGGHITFDCGPHPVTIPITSPLVTSATRDIVLDGKGLITLDGGGVTRILEKPFTPGSHIDKTSGNDLVIQNMRFINGRAPAATKTQDDKARGGALWVTSPGTRLHIINSIFENNRTTSMTDEDNQGGAIYAGNIYETVIVGSVFVNNEAGSGGAFGGIATGLQVYNSRFTNNRAADATTGGIVRGHGGAIHLDGVSNSFNPITGNTVEVCGSVFDGNTATRGGGALKVTISDNLNTKATYARSTFSNNRVLDSPPAEGHGGAIYHIEDDLAGGVNEDNIEIRESTFNGNYAARQGGGVWMSVNGRGRVVNSTFFDNRAATAGTNVIGQGGGMIISRGTIDIIHATFASNFATFQGGAIFAGNPSAAAVTLTSSIFSANRLDPTHTNPVTTEFQGYHTNRALLNGGGNIQFPRTKAPDFNNDINNLITSPASAILFQDPQLAPLANNGGPTPTMAIVASSPGFNRAAAATCPVTDQRGVTRPQGGACDVGAYELVLALSLTPPFVGVGEAGTVVIVSGAGFDASSTIVIGGVERPTTFVSATELRTTLTAADVANAGDLEVRVSNSALPPVTLRVLAQVYRGYLPIVRR